LLLQIHYAIISAEISSVHIISPSLAIASRRVSHAVVVAVIKPNIEGGPGKLSGLGSPNLIPNRNLKSGRGDFEITRTKADFVNQIISVAFTSLMII
jgi:hypothetical protein